MILKNKFFIYRYCLFYNKQRCNFNVNNNINTNISRKILKLRKYMLLYLNISEYIKMCIYKISTKTWGLRPNS